ncbi:putative PDF receptor-like [Apostichopus japonicus]|uniref:Putative PDF receptor-like n=2 Tax=Stichopus japonicus TaxID=307972 RepID=A0A2G8LQC5_STIJA|nr:putative PDF receptor-like [Apostichopus japonicus]
MNVFLLLNIIRVLITKLRESQTSETKQVRKATKACIVLLPLLGTANLVWIPKVPEPGKSSRFYFASYYYVVLFLDAYQGFFLALLYCFLNIDVRVTIKRKWQGWMNARNPYRAHGSVVTTTTDVRMSSLDNNDSEWGGK